MNMRTKPKQFVILGVEKICPIVKYRFILLIFVNVILLLTVGILHDFSIKVEQPELRMIECYTSQDK